MKRRSLSLRRRSRCCSFGGVEHRGGLSKLAAEPPGTTGSSSCRSARSQGRVGHRRPSWAPTDLNASENKICPQLGVQAHWRRCATVSRRRRRRRRRGSRDQANGVNAGAGRVLPRPASTRTWRSERQLGTRRGRPRSVGLPALLVALAAGDQRVQLADEVATVVPAFVRQRRGVGDRRAVADSVLEVAMRRLFQVATACTPFEFHARIAGSRWTSGSWTRRSSWSGRVGVPSPSRERGRRRPSATPRWRGRLRRGAGSRTPDRASPGEQARSASPAVLRRGRPARPDLGAKPSQN